MDTLLFALVIFESIAALVVMWQLVFKHPVEYGLTAAAVGLLAALLVFFIVKAQQPYAMPEQAYADVKLVHWCASMFVKMFSLVIIVEIPMWFLQRRLDRSRIHTIRIRRN